MTPFFKHAKNFVAKNEDRPVFKGIYFDGKRAIVTNGHVLVMATNFPSEKRLVHFKTGESIDGTYPDINKVIPDKMQFEIVVTNVSEWLTAFKNAMMVSKPNEYMSYFDFCDGAAMLRVEFEGTKFETVLPVEEMVEIPKVYFNSKYMHDVLALYVDAEVDDFVLGINTPTSPMKLTNRRGLLAVITPMIGGGN